MRRTFPDRLDEASVRPPAACPACKSTNLTTASKTVTSSSYWRCVECGEVWNVERLKAGARNWPPYR